jgi:alpha-glucosidase
MQQPVSCTAQAPAGPLELHIYPGKTGASFLYYEDDGTTLNYTRGQYFQQEMVLDGRQLILRAAEGDFASRFAHIKICLHGLAESPLPPVVRVNETSVETVPEEQRFCRPLAFLSPDETVQDPYGSLEMETVTLPHERKEVTITWAEDSS